jgi:hypothetical protein
MVLTQLKYELHVDRIYARAADDPDMAVVLYRAPIETWGRGTSKRRGRRRTLLAESRPGSTPRRIGSGGQAGAV